MKAYVFTDKALQRHAGQFVWLSLDVEKAQNAPYKKKYGADTLPTFFVVDPKTENVALRWVGGATVPQLQKILADGLVAVKGSARGVEEILARADRAYGAADYAKAAAAYREALSAAPPNWSRFARATESLIYALYETKEYAACAKAARDVFPKLARTSSAANVAATCAAPDGSRISLTWGASALPVGSSAEDALARADVALMERKTEKRR